MKMHLYEKLKKCTFVLKNRKNAEEGEKGNIKGGQKQIVHQRFLLRNPRKKVSQQNVLHVCNFFRWRTSQSRDLPCHLASVGFQIPDYQDSNPQFFIMGKKC